MQRLGSRDGWSRLLANPWALFGKGAGGGGDVRAGLRESGIVPTAVADTAPVESKDRKVARRDGRAKLREAAMCADPGLCAAADDQQPGVALPLVERGGERPAFAGEAHQPSHWAIHSAMSSAMAALSA
jgi:hypothetical protein